MMKFLQRLKAWWLCKWHGHKYDGNYYPYTNCVRCKRNIENIWS